jgi:hypothetical protein
VSGTAAPAGRLQAGFVLGNTAAMLAATGVAATALWPVYRSGAFLLLVVVAAVLGCGLALAGARWSWPAWLVGSVTILAYLLVGVPLAVPGQVHFGVLPSLAGLAELVPATALSWKQLITIVLPVGSYQALLVPALILVLLSTVIGLSLALRTRTAELALLAPLALFVAGIALGPGTAAAPTASGLGLFAVLVLWLLGLNRHRRRRRLLLTSATGPPAGAERRAGTVASLLAGALVPVVALAAGILAAAGLPPTASRDVLRTRVAAPFDARAYPSPLTEFRGYLRPELAETVLFDVTGLPAGGRLRLASLDDYDGVVYSVGTSDATGTTDSGTFTRLPYRLDQESVRGEEATVSVTVREYSGVWVPGIGQLERIEFTGASAAARQESFVYNDIGGSAAVVSGLARGDSYTSTAVVPAAATDLADALPGPAVLPPVGVLPDGLDDTLAGYVTAGQSQGEQLQAMLNGLAANGYISHGFADEPASRSGHGADRIGELLDDRPMLGDAEQYAVTAALMARQLGFPARVVMGFVPAADEGTVSVRGSDASAWIEVQTRADGWVTLDPTPPVRDVPERQPEDPSTVARPQTVLPPDAPDAIEQVTPAPPESSTADPPADADPFWATVRLVLTVLGWSVLGLGVLAAPVLGILLAKWRRRRRRRLGSRPVERIVGGWQDYQDTVTDYRLPVPALATRSELAGAVGDQRALQLAAAVDRAAFAPDGASASESDGVWLAVRRLQNSLHAAHTRRERLRAAISLRSFGRYARRTTGRGRSARTPGGAGESTKGTGL